MIDWNSFYANGGYYGDHDPAYYDTRPYYDEDDEDEDCEEEEEEE